MLHVLFEISVEQRVKAREQANYRLYSCCCFCQTDYSYYNTNTYTYTHIAIHTDINIYVCVSSCVKLVYSSLLAADAVDLTTLHTYIYGNRFKNQQYRSSYRYSQLDRITHLSFCANWRHCLRLCMRGAEPKCARRVLVRPPLWPWQWAPCYVFI